MKKILLALSLVACAVPVCGASQLKLVFESSDGSQHAYDAQNLVMTASSGLLNVSNDAVSESLPLQGLSKMYFSDAFSSVESIGADFASAPVSVVSLSGVNLGSFTSLSEAASQLAPGYYIFTSGNISRKVCIQ